jgi:hypothetical protein
MNTKLAKNQLVNDKGTPITWINMVVVATHGEKEWRTRVKGMKAIQNQNVVDYHEKFTKLNKLFVKTIQQL